MAQTEREQVLDQLKRVVSHHTFKNSKRCVGLLGYLVDHTLAGQSCSIKERMLGVEVFGRSADYDTNTDPIVRTTATEIRKRLAQYYQEVADPSELNIKLLAGSYIPSFEFPAENANREVGGGGQLPDGKTSDVREPPTAGNPGFEPESHPGQPLPADKGWNVRLSLLQGILIAAILIALVCGAFLLHRSSDSGLSRFWNPVFKSQNQVLICVGAIDVEGSLDLTQPFTREMADRVNGLAEWGTVASGSEVRPMLMFDDADKITRISEMLSKQNMRFLVRPSETVTLADLRNGPVVLVGILANSWSVRLTSKLRFHVRMDYATQKMWIEDSQHPEYKNWNVPWGEAYSHSYDDYALVTRCQDPLSGQVAVEIGGLGLHGTRAAGEFVVSSKELDRLSTDLRNPNRNVQIVLRITVVNGEAGPPQIIAIHYW